MTQNVESLPTLNNIIDDITAPPNNLTEGDLDEFRESIYLIIEDFVKKNTIDYMYYDFEQRVYKYTYEIAEMLFKEVIDNDISFCLTELVEETILLFFSLIRKPRSYPGPHLTTPRNKRDVQRQIQKLRNIPQPEQNTPDWFNFRWTRLTASSAWKALDSDAKKNELIYSKCKPIEKVCEKLRFENSLGTYIILYTSRNMRSFNGNIGLINKYTSSIQTNWLFKNHIPYDELYFGKPWGKDLAYIDDKSLPLEKFIYSNKII